MKSVVERHDDARAKNGSWESSIRKRERTNESTYVEYDNRRESYS